MHGDAQATALGENVLRRGAAERHPHGGRASGARWPMAAEARCDSCGVIDGELERARQWRGERLQPPFLQQEDS